MSREIEDKDFIGKTIASIEHGCSNLVEFTFTDGTIVKLSFTDPVWTPGGPWMKFVIEE